MHRKIANNYMISLSGRYSLGSESVSISKQGMTILLSPYQTGDEFNDAIIVRRFDHRGRLSIPSQFLAAIGATQYVEVTMLENGTVELTAMDARAIGLKHKNK